MAIASDYVPIDISKGNAPDLAELAEEVRRTNRSRVIQADGKDVAVLVPAPKGTPTKRQLKSG